MLSFITTAVAIISLSFNPPAQTKSKEWVSLFDGKTTKGWHSYGKSAAGSAWKVEEGSLFFDADAKKTSPTAGGDLVSDASFTNFHLKLEWKIAKNGNSGIIFWVQDDTTKYKQVWFTGPEMQVLDNDGHPDGKIKKHRAGNLYDLVEGKEGAVNKVGEWNMVDIISYNGKLDFYLNGINTVSTTYGDAEWRALIAGSKFKDKADFGKVFGGHIALQDHGDKVWYRNIMIKKL